MSTISVTLPMQFASLSADYFRLEILPRGSARHNNLIGLLRRIQCFAQSGDIDSAQGALDQAIKSGKFNVSSGLPIKIQEEMIRANSIFEESARQTIRYWSQK